MQIISRSSRDEKTTEKVKKLEIDRACRSKKNNVKFEFEIKAM
jgi:hypothetical protein